MLWWILVLYLIIGAALIVWGVHEEPMILIAWPLFPFFILLWPYFLVRMFFNR